MNHAAAPPPEPSHHRLKRQASWRELPKLSAVLWLTRSARPQLTRSPLENWAEDLVSLVLVDSLVEHLVEKFIDVFRVSFPKKRKVILEKRTRCFVQTSSASEMAGNFVAFFDGFEVQGESHRPALWEAATRAVVASRCDVKARPRDVNL